MTTITINKETSIIAGFMLILGLCIGLTVGFFGGVHRGGENRFEGRSMMRGYGNNTEYGAPGYGMMRAFQQRVAPVTQAGTTTTPVTK